ncbi:MAG TPA: hypothetical protein VHL53_22815, partial [Acidimicrobiia bacterium]|nr:hypothetical protein [Acidimicrobiia bacterium]
VRSGDRPRLRRSSRPTPEPGPLRSVLPARPVDASGEPVHPIRALLADSVPQLLDPLPDLPEAPAEVASVAEALPSAAAPSSGDRPSVEEARPTAGDGPAPIPAVMATLAGHEPALLRRKHG